MDEKITIIEGPPPTFEIVGEGWVLGLNECVELTDVAVTQLRTYNGPALVERCVRAWRKQENIYLEYRDNGGFENRVPILAARAMEVEEGHTLLLWVRLEHQESELETGYDDVSGDSEDDFGFPNS